MASDNPPAPNVRGWVRLLIVFVVAFDVAAFFQWADGAFQSEFGGRADEAQNYFAGLHTRDALVRTPERAGDGEKFSVASAPDRKWGFSHALGGWMAVFGASRIAVLLFMAALAAATVTLIFYAVHREHGDWAAAVASLLWLCAPAVRESFETILPEQSGALILTGAALLWARMVDEGSLRRTAVPKWIGAAALLVLGCILAFVIAVSVKAVPGHSRAAGIILRECVSVLGIAATVFAIVGAVIRPRAEAQAGAVRVAMVALVAGVLVARLVKFAIPDVRVLIVATPALAILAARGAVALAGIVGSKAVVPAEVSRRRTLWLFLLLLLALPMDLLHAWQKDWRGFGPAALTLIEESHGPARVLVVSDARGEGMFASEMAMRDGERQITVERGSETLAQSVGETPGGRPEQRFIEDGELLAYLTSGRIRYVVLDSAVPYEGHAGYHDQARRVLEGNVRNFWPAFDNAIIRDGELHARALRIFRVMRGDGAELQ